MPSDSPTLVIRYSDAFSPPGGTIEAHLDVLRSWGYVWFGKMGKRVGPVHIDRLTEDIRQKRDPTLILAGSVRGGTQLYTCTIQDVQYRLPPAERDQVPEYYRERTRDFSVWFKLGSILQLDDRHAKLLVVVSSQKRLLDVLGRSSSTTFLVSTP